MRVGWHWLLLGRQSLDEAPTLGIVWPLPRRCGSLRAKGYEESWMKVPRAVFMRSVDQMTANAMGMEVGGREWQLVRREWMGHCVEATTFSFKVR